MSARSVNWRPLLFVAVGALLVVWAVWPRTPEVVLHAGSNTYELERTLDPETKLRGLGGRDSMAQNKGMLFAYDQSARNRCFWMKDMRFAIDIIWVDSNKKVVHIAPNVTPDTYPSSYCTEEPSQFVIELNANEVQRSGIKTGQSLLF